MNHCLFLQIKKIKFTKYFGTSFGESLQKGPSNYASSRLLFSPHGLCLMWVCGTHSRGLDHGGAGGGLPSFNKYLSGAYQRKSFRLPKSFLIVSSSSLQNQVNIWELPGSPMIRTQRFHCKGPGSIPGWGTKILQTVWHGQNKTKIPNQINTK